MTTIRFRRHNKTARIRAKIWMFRLPFNCSQIVTVICILGTLWISDWWYQILSAKVCFVYVTQKTNWLVTAKKSDNGQGDNHFWRQMIFLKKKLITRIYCLTRVEVLDLRLKFVDQKSLCLNFCEQIWVVLTLSRKFGFVSTFSTKLWHVWTVSTKIRYVSTSSTDIF